MSITVYDVLSKNDIELCEESLKDCANITKNIDKLPNISVLFYNILRNSF
jgi:hypothetical protein